MSTWLPVSDGSGVDLLIPMEWGDPLTDDDIVAAMSTIPLDLFVDRGLCFPICGTGATLLAACDSSAYWVYGSVEVAIEPGSYSIATAEYDYGPAWLRVHRLTRATAAGDTDCRRHL